MSKITIEYMAGFFDADGNVNLRKGSGDAIRFANTNKDVLILMKKFFGGHIYISMFALLQCNSFVLFCLVAWCV